MSGPVRTRWLVLGMLGWFLLVEGRWHVEKLLQVVPPNIVNTILKVLILESLVDKLIWKQSTNGSFSTKSAWQIIRSSKDVKPIYTPCWTNLLYRTISFIYSRFRARRIPVHNILKAWGVELASKCRCCQSEETVEHLFFSTDIAIHECVNVGMCKFEHWRGYPSTARAWGVSFNMERVTSVAVIKWIKPLRLILS